MSWKTQARFPSLVSEWQFPTATSMYIRNQSTESLKKMILGSQEARSLSHVRPPPGSPSLKSVPRSPRAPLQKPLLSLPSPLPCPPHLPFPSWTCTTWVGGCGRALFRCLPLSNTGKIEIRRDQRRPTITPKLVFSPSASLRLQSREN